MERGKARVTLRALDNGERREQWVQVRHLPSLGRRIRLDGRVWAVTGWLLPSDVRPR